VIPISSAEDYAFLTPVVPLRGYNYNARAGTKYGLVNLEMRYPFLKYLVAGPLPIAFQNITGVAFVDAGGAWTDNSSFRASTRNAEGVRVPQDLLIGTGVGARVFLLYFLVRFDIAWQYTYHGFSEPKYYFSLGSDF
jgi:outer membrane protein assembly factor BamA